ncbi:MAG: Spy/CpxP family protein refolding chaperone [Candidatus Binatia bacterium]
MKTKQGLLAAGLVGVGILVLSSLSAPAYGQWRGHGHGMRGAFGLLSARYFRDLTAEQQTQLQGIRDAHAETFRTLRSQMRQLRVEIADKLYSPGVVTGEDLASQMKQLADLREKLRREGLVVALEVRKLLTTEQLTKAAERRERLRALRAEMLSLYEGK